MVIALPPATLSKFNTCRLRKGHKLVRLHSAAYLGNEFNPCKGSMGRFSPLKLPGGECLPTLYAADNFECAVHESLFHDLPYDDATRKFVTKDRVLGMTVSKLATTVDLTLAVLNEPDLNLLGLTRGDLVDSMASSYPITGRWAEVFHRGNKRIAGLVWTSRRCDPKQAYVFFGDRVPDGALLVENSVLVASSAEHFDKIRKFGQRAGITISI